jgi:dihydroorotate dehydrogenase
MYRLLLAIVVLFVSAEHAHETVISLLQRLTKWRWLRRLIRRFCFIEAPELRVTTLGSTFANPVGLAAGFDKNAVVYEVLGDFGFSFIEVGTVTKLPQDGNPKPRLFRLTKDRALINRMGFNNIGSAAMKEHLAPGQGTRLGLSIGKNKATAEADAVEDYLASIRLLASAADYVVLNISSPNTPGLRNLQRPEHLRPLIVETQRVLREISPQKHVPLLVKVDPDLTDEHLVEIGEMAVATGLDGLVATNTTTNRSGLKTPQEYVDACGAGGLSGAPVAARSLHTLATLFSVVGRKVPLISVGGIETGRDAWERICAGASLVQIYTGFIYGGPLIARRMNRDLLRRVRLRGASSIQDAIGRRDWSDAAPVELKPSLVA